MKTLLLATSALLLAHTAAQTASDQALFNATNVVTCDQMDQTITLDNGDKFVVGKMLGSGESRNGCAYETKLKEVTVVAKTPKGPTPPGSPPRMKFEREKEGLTKIEELVTYGEDTTGQLWLLMTIHPGVGFLDTAAFKEAISKPFAECAKAFSHLDEDEKWQHGTLFAPAIEAYKKYHKFGDIVHLEVTIGNTIWSAAGSEVWFIDWENWTTKPSSALEAMIMAGERFFFSKMTPEMCCNTPRKGLCAGK